MTFMLTFSWKVTTDGAGRNEGVKRFLETGGLPPKGAKLLSRWTRADFSGGYDVIETEDVKALTEFCVFWGDLMQLEVVPVIGDSDLAEVLKRR